MTKVLVVATSKKTKGGITSVIKAHECGLQWKTYHCHWIQTHCDGSILIKLYYLVTAFIEYLFLLPFYDIVHIHHSLQNSTHRKFFFFKLAKLCRKKTIVHVHCGNQLLKCWNKDYQYMYSKCDIAIALSNSIGNIIESFVGKRNNIRILYNPCPIISDNKNIYVKEKQILFSGTLSEGKGYHILIEAFAIISKKYPEWKIVFAGDGEIQKANKLAEEFGIKQQCMFLGWVDGAVKDKVFRETSIFCLPSYAEGFPMAVLEAWAYGLPVIATPVGGIPDVGIDGENMLLFNPGDVEKLSKQLDLLISNDVLRSKIEIESQKFAKYEFNMQTINKQLGGIYKELSMK